jgi:hypothetical protein
MVARDEMAALISVALTDWIVILFGPSISRDKDVEKRMMLRLPFQTTLLLAPLAYAIHHFEEHMLFNFREWRLRYFPDSNSLSTEAVFVIITGITLVYILLFTTLRTRVAAWGALLFLMASQVHNVIFHIGGTVVFQDFSPGLVTAILLYIPVNVLVVRAALADGLATTRQMWALFVGGGLLFWGFEVYGPSVMLAAVVASWGWTILDAHNARSATA